MLDSQLRAIARKMFVCGLFYLLIVSALAEDDLFAFDDEDGDETLSLAETANVRKVRLIDEGDAPWRIAQRIPQEEDPKAPVQSEDSNPPVQKRRRLRKRKRRPFLDEQGELVRLRRRRPVRLDEADDGWKEMAAESPPRIYSRRRSGPVFDRERDVNVKVVVERQGAPEASPAALATLQEIKDILKQAGGLSLSEILLQKNLTLNDLLSGSHNAISALSERPIQNVSARSPILLKNVAEMRNNEEGKLDEAGYTEIGMKNELATEPTTEKRIFVPSHPKYYTAINYRPELQLVTEAPQVEANSTRKLPMTSAQMNMKIQKARKNLTTAFVADVANALVSNTGPLKMSFNLEDFDNHNIATTQLVSLEERSDPITTPMTTNDPTIQDTSQYDEIRVKIENAEDRPTTAKLVTTQRYSRRPKIESTTNRTSQKPELEPKKTAQSAKEEIMEVIRDERAQSELAIVLTKRNMTIDELVEQRERGSSQRHLAEIFENSTRKAEMTSSETFDANYKRRSKQFFKPSNRTNTSTKNRSLATSKPLEDVSMSEEEIEPLDTKPSTIPAFPTAPPTSFPIYKIESNKSKEIPPVRIPIWKTIYPGIHIDPEHNEKNVELDAIDQSIRQAVDVELNSISRVHSNLDEYDDYLELPAGVKSALFASLAIIGMSLAIFLTILVIFRWSQKHRKQLGDTDTSAASSANNSIFSCSKIKTPILQQDQPRRTIRTFVSETLGKSPNFYAQHYRQSMSDTWENNELPYQ